MTLITAAAKELPRVGLDDALRICHVLRHGRANRYDRAAVRWLGRFALEAREASVDDLRRAAEWMAELPNDEEALGRLHELCVRHGVAA